jgi:hypothetical protein
LWLVPHQVGLDPEHSDVLAWFGVATLGIPWRKSAWSRLTASSKEITHTPVAFPAVPEVDFPLFRATALRQMRGYGTTGKREDGREALSRGTMSDWLGGRGVPTDNKLLTFLVVCGVPREMVPRWQSAVERVRRAPAGSEQTATLESVVDPRLPLLRRRPVIVAGVSLVLVAVVVGVVVNSRMTSAAAGPAPTSAASPTSAATTSPVAITIPALATAASTGAARTGQAAITAVYNVPDGCSTTDTISGDLHGDPRAAGKALWIAAVLSAPPNVLYYPKMRVTPQDGRFTVTIPANTQPGARTGRFDLVVSSTDQADADLQTSLQADETLNDSLYPDTRRLHLQAGNVELATTPFVTQRC